MKKDKKRGKDFGRIAKPRPERSFIFRGVRFYTQNLGNVDTMSEKFVWFAVGKWTYAEANEDPRFQSVFSSLDAAVADRFNLWEHLGFSYAPKFRDRDQIEAAKELRHELAMALNSQRKKAA